MFYTIKNPKKFSLKKEGDYYVLETKFGDKITNEIGAYVVELMKEEKSLEDIINEIMLKCHIDEEKAFKFLLDFLSELEVVGLISFDKSFFSSIIQLNEINVVGEYEYKALSEFMLKNISNSIYHVKVPSVKKYYSLYFLRSRCFYNREVYFYDSFDGNKFENLFGIENYDEINKPIIISFIYSGSTDTDKLFYFYELIEKKLKSEDKYKIKIIIEEGKENGTITNFLRQFKYNKEGCLQKEDGINNYDIYAKLI